MESKENNWLKLAIKKESLKLFRQNEWLGERQNLSKKMTLTIYFIIVRVKVVHKHFIRFIGPLGFYKNIKDGYSTLEKAE